MFEIPASKIELFHDIGAETAWTLPSVVKNRHWSLLERLCKVSARETEMEGRHEHFEPLCTRC